MAEKVSGLVLKSAGSSAPQAIPGLPGLWSTDAEASVVPSDLGRDLGELREQAEGLGFEVEEVEWEREVALSDEGEELKVGEIKERIESFSDADLEKLSSDSRPGAARAAQKEISRRAEAATGGLVGPVGVVVGGNAPNVSSAVSGISEGGVGAVPVAPISTEGGAT